MTLFEQRSFRIYFRKGKDDALWDALGEEAVKMSQDPAESIPLQQLIRNILREEMRRRGHSI